MYTNLIDTNDGYVYATEHACDAKTAEWKMITSDDVHSTRVYAFAVPDGVSPYVNEKRMTGPPETSRLYMYSDRPMSEDERDLITAQYKTVRYPKPNLNVPCHNSVRFPDHNFLLIDARGPDDYASFLEFRYYETRTRSATTLYDPRTGNHYAFVPPDRCPLTIIMPTNFVSAGPKRGLLYFPKTELIVHVFSSHFLRGPEPYDPASVPTTTKHRVTDALFDCAPHTVREVFEIFARLTLPNAYAPGPNQLVAYDDFITAVVGPYDDLNINSR